MRCKKCPLISKDAEEPCYIAEGDYGVEYDNGEIGCRHSWNWCKKRAEEHWKSLVFEPNEQEVHKMTDKEFFEIVENYMQNKNDNTKLVANNKKVHLIVSTPLQSKQSAFHEMSLSIKEYLKYCDIPTLIVADEQEVKVVSIVQTHDLV